MILWTRILILTALLAASLGTAAQSAYVLDSDTDEGIPEVTLSGRSFSVISNTSGLVDLSGFSQNDTVLVQHVAYYEQLVPLSRILEAGDIHLKQRSYFIPAFIVSANKWQQNEEKVADHITLLDSREIAFSNPATSADLLASSGEVFVQKSQAAGGSPMIRGFSANRVLIVVDGVRMNNAIYRSGNLQNVINIDPNALRVTEVIHGPGAMTYGSDAIGGVMDFHTFDPELRKDSSSLVSGTGLYRATGASAERTYNLRLNFAWEKCALLLNYSKSEFDAPRMGSDGPAEYLRNWYVGLNNGRDTVLLNADPRKQIGNDFELEHLLAKWRYRPNDTWDIILSARSSSISPASRYDRLIQVNSESEPRYGEWYYGEQRWTMFNTRIENHRETGLWNNARLTMAYQHYDESRIDRRYKSSTKRTRKEEVEGAWLNLDFENQISERTDLFYGLESVFNEVRSSAYRENVDAPSEDPTIINPRYPDGSTWSTNSVYGSVTHDVSKKLLFNGGLRLNNSALEAEFDTTLFPYPVNSTSISNYGLTGSAGLIWKVDSAQRISFDVSRGFRSPNIDDIGKVFDSEPGSVIVPNIDLGPEYVTSFEIGLQRQVSKRLKIDLNAYYTLLDKAIVRRAFAVDGQDSIQYEGELSQVLALQNAAKATVYGMHLGLNWKLHHDWALECHVNVQEGEEEAADGSLAPARHAPPAFGKLSATWSRNKLKVKAYLDASAEFGFSDLAPSEQNKPHIYAIDENGDPFSPSWYTVNLKLEYVFEGERFVLAGGVENIADKRYKTYSSGLVSPGRNSVLSLRINF